MDEREQEKIEFVGKCLGLFEATLSCADIGYLKFLAKQEPQLNKIDLPIVKQWKEEGRSERLQFFIETAEKFRGLGFHEYATNKEE